MPPQNWPIGGNDNRSIKYNLHGSQKRPHGKSMLRKLNQKQIGCKNSECKCLFKNTRKKKFRQSQMDKKIWLKNKQLTERTCAN
jgi:hypothetical protein